MTAKEKLTRKIKIDCCLDEIDCCTNKLEKNPRKKDQSLLRGWILKQKAILKELKYRGKIRRKK